ncbi:hypothetical protein CEUSTIGMA_g9073.t1 [Chlamydomonas eustigma]|uniref:D-2-hydroxyglutarate dehydrogenase n=1 Tax=Chlamydomonas eustigma TaxID=1157962 RepID=A0A250XEY9_9CHLO|nr:hypothetical protein CEUSTIGMA_g9073.t1 [Chlamydomonas eustigma]|eukprot:GAX81645.1 hypothetical protein CEUSTIGMA_g9073.t1 [Chlamydomonas eustigma]
MFTNRIVFNTFKAVRSNVLFCAGESSPIFKRCGHCQATRGPSYSQLQTSDVEWFKRCLGESNVVTDVERLKSFNRDWMKKYQGHSQLLLRPKTTQHVSEVLAYCNERSLPIVPQGGNTGLVGGGVPVFDEIILSTQGMTRILSFEESSGALVAEAGCVLQALDDHVTGHGYIMPLDLGAKGSCCIGGNVSTNAGGLRLLRYGSLHGSVLGLEVVMADGTILDLLKTLRKDNTGYDLKQLFIGAEGTLGVITAVAIQCAPRPASVQSVFLACPSFEAVTKVLGTAKTMLAEILSAAEFLDQHCMRVVEEQLEGVSNPLTDSGTCTAASAAVAAAPGSEGTNKGPACTDSNTTTGCSTSSFASTFDPDNAASSSSSASLQLPPRFYMVIETHGSHEAHDVEKLDAFLEAVMSEGHVLDGCVATSKAQSDSMWHIREVIAEACGRAGSVYKYDVSLPVQVMYQLVEAVQQRLASQLPHRQDILTLGYGHVGDGNLHLNVSVPSGYSQEVQEVLEPFIYEWIQGHSGSISAEHGIGLMKAGALTYSKSLKAIQVMSSIKSMLDPKGIINPYKVVYKQQA